MNYNPIAPIATLSPTNGAAEQQPLKLRITTDIEAMKVRDIQEIENAVTFTAIGEWLFKHTNITSEDWLDLDGRSARKVAEKAATLLWEMLTDDPKGTADN